MKVFTGRSFLHRLLVGNYAGRAFGKWFCVVYLPRVSDSRDLVALIEHEKVHGRQVERLGLFRYLWRYWTSADYRLRLEFEGYVTSKNLDPRNTDERVVSLLVNNYYLPARFNYFTVMDEWIKFKSSPHLVTKED